MEEVKETKEKKVRKPRTKKAVEEPVVKEETPKKKTTARKKKTEEVKAEPPVLEKEEKPKRKAPARKKKAEEAPVEQPKAEEAPVEEPIKTEEPKKESKPTRAERIEAVKTLVRDMLKSECKWGELLDKVAGLYLEKYPAEKTENINDLNGRIGSIIGQMKKDGEVTVEGGVATLVAATEPPVEKPVEPPMETPVKTEEKKQDVTPVYDLSSLFSARKSVKTEKKEEPKAAAQKALDERVEETEKTAPKKAEEPVKTEKKPALKKPAPEKKPAVRRVARLRAEESSRDPLKDAFLKRLRSLGGDYFEYYSVYLLERYSRKNGRRLEGLRVSGGEHDGGIDGFIEVSDRLGFRETLYLQAKNWAPTDEKWLVGETLLQQFIGAVAYRQAQEGKLHARGVYMTTSYFSSGAKQMLEKMSDKFVGYDGDDLYEAAKECSFGLKEVNGVWKLDEDLLSGEKAFFSM